MMSYRTWPLRRLSRFVGVAAVAALGGCPVKVATPVDVGPSALLQIRDDDHVLAVGDPAVTVIEYGDFECPICGLFAQLTFPAIKLEYIDTGKVRWVYRHLPLAKHSHAETAAEASECAGVQGRFWEYHDVLLVNQLALTDADLTRYAGQVGLDAAEFAMCLSSHVESARVTEDMDSATQLNVTHTPTFFIGTQQAIGLLSVEEFSAILDAALAAPR